MLNVKGLLTRKNVCKRFDGMDKKMEGFIKWYTKEFVIGKYTKSEEYFEPRDMRNAIEKMAVWYELRFNDNDVNDLYPGSSIDGMSSKQAFLQNNKQIEDIRELLDEEEKNKFSDIIELVNWKDVLSIRSFVKSLSYKEKWILSRPKYPSIVYLREPRELDHLHLTSKGKVSVCEISNPHGGYYKFENWNAIDVVRYLKQQSELPINNELEPAIKSYDKRVLLKENFLDAVMYRIIERGGNRIGPRRAFMFAKEFWRSIDIPMKYGVDFSDPGLRAFTLEYIKAGGDYKLECLSGYFSRIKEKEPFSIITVEEILRIFKSNCAEMYTREEMELHQKLVNELFMYANFKK